MSIDLDVICTAVPSIEVANRLAVASLGLRSVDCELDGLGVFQVPAGHHEFVGEYVISLTAHRRTTPVYLGMLVLASSLAVAYSGRMHCETGFFPRVDAVEVLRLCFSDSEQDATAMWTALQRTTGSKPGAKP